MDFKTHGFVRSGKNDHMTLIVSCTSNHTYGSFQNFRNLNIHSLSQPHSCCISGGLFNVLVSEFSLSTVTEVFPVFVLVCNANDPKEKPLRVEDCIRSFRPIDKESIKVHRGTMTFQIPTQDNCHVIKEIDKSKYALHVALYR